MATLYVMYLFHFLHIYSGNGAPTHAIGTEVLTRHPSVTDYINNNFNFRYEMNLVGIPSQAGPGGKKFH